MSETVTISVARLQELEAVETKVKTQLAQDIQRMNEYNKAHPEKVLERVNRHINKNREAYNARRRELRRLKKESAATTPV